MIQSKRDSWRVNADQLAAKADNGFDEVVVGCWLHLERMDTGGWWLRLGDQEADIRVTANGKATVRWRDEGRSSSGQDPRLSTGGPGFDSPSPYQPKKTRRV